MKYLGIDHGESKIGLALGDSRDGFALPYKIVKAIDFFKSINNILQEEGVDEIVLGLPKNLNNKNTQQTEIVYSFLEKLKQIVKLPIHLEDERMTSRLGKTLQFNSKKNEDALSAALILDSFLKRKYGV